jgi:hypothetical protein
MNSDNGALTLDIEDIRRNINQDVKGLALGRLLEQNQGKGHETQHGQAKGFRFFEYHFFSFQDFEGY